MGGAQGRQFTTDTRILIAIYGVNRGANGPPSFLETRQDSLSVLRFAYVRDLVGFPIPQNIATAYRVVRVACGQDMQLGR